MNWDKLGFNLSETGLAKEFFPSLAMFISYHDPEDYLSEYVYPADLQNPESTEQMGVIIIHNSNKNRFQISIRIPDPLTEEVLRTHIEKVQDKLAETTGRDIEIDMEFDSGYDRWIEPTVFDGELEEDWELEFLLPKITRGIWKNEKTH